VKSKRRIDCPQCNTTNPVDEALPLREQFCKKCLWALKLDNPDLYGLANNEPYEVEK